MTKKIFLVSLALMMLFVGCSKYGYVNINYPEPPAVILPDHIHSIALVNRSLVKADDKQKRDIESIATGEVAGSDKLASDECLKGVFDRINGWHDLVVVIPEKTRLYGTGTRETPELLDWNLVKDICSKNHTDALLVLETFDSNSDLLVSAITSQVRNVMNGNAPKPDLPANIRMNVVAFWRLYDPSTQSIVDQYKSTHFMNFRGIGVNYALAPPEALPQTAYASGQEYISRFLPGYYTVRRDMYKRGKGSSKEAFKRAFRKAEVADWQGALDSWTTIVQNSKRKSAGRACLDIAVSYEVLGNTDKALEWVKKSYEDYNDKLARDYSKILLNRKSLE